MSGRVLGSLLKVGCNSGYCCTLGTVIVLLLPVPSKVGKGT